MMTMTTLIHITAWILHEMHIIMVILEFYEKAFHWQNMVPAQGTTAVSLERND